MLLSGAPTTAFCHQMNERTSTFEIGVLTWSVTLPIIKTRALPKVCEKVTTESTPEGLMLNSRSSDLTR